MKKYEQIVAEIKAKILTTEYVIGELIPSEQQLQNEFDVSRHTVRQALAVLVNEGYVRKEQGLGTFADDKYLSKDNGSKKTVGIITTYFSDYIFPSIIRGIEHTLRNEGYSLLLSSTNNDLKQEKQCLDMMLNQNIQALIVEPTKSNIMNPNMSFYLAFKQRGIPIVMINAFYEEIKFPYIRVDDEQSGYLVTKELLDNGHTNTILVTKNDDMQGKQRLTGYISAYSEANIHLESSQIFNYSTENRGEIISSAVDFLVNNRDVTGVVCYNDEVANRFVRELSDVGISVPQDISIVGIDNAYISYAGEIPLTTATHPQEKMGVDAAEMVIDIINGNTEIENIVYEPSLIKRGSVKKIN